MKNKFKKLDFTIAVNPFLRTAEITHKDETIEMNFQDLDEWNAFRMDGKDFDIHFYYDEEFSVSIYDETNINNSHSVTLTINF